MLKKSLKSDQIEQHISNFKIQESFKLLILLMFAVSQCIYVLEILKRRFADIQLKVDYNKMYFLRYSQGKYLGTEMVVCYFFNVYA